MLLSLDVNLHLLLLTSFFIFGINYVTDYQRDTREEALYPDKVVFEWKNPFWRLRFWSIKYFGQYWSQPLFTCPMCMASTYGTIFYLLFTPISSLNFQTWVVAVVALCGLNRIVKNFT